MLVLGIESSCDETAASVVKNGKQILSNIVYSQEEIHSEYGGVVPELASREHIRRIDDIVKKALEKSDKRLPDIDVIAVTKGPGLIGSLLIGVTFSKILSVVLSKPIVGVNHIYAHLYAPELEKKIEYPALGLIVSGGHTSIYYIGKLFNYIRLSRTRDDAAGEIMDKIAKFLNLGYPGGPVIEELSKQGKPDVYDFSLPQMSDGTRDFSFSGIKSAAIRLIKEEGNNLKVHDFAASFQNIIIEYLIDNFFYFFERKKVKSLILSGGVARNSYLRDRFKEEGEKRGSKVCISSPILCSDNAAMIAALGYHYFKRKKFFNLMEPPFSRFEPKGFK